jgi:hypothetical protein
MKRSLQRRDQPSVGETKPSSEPRHKENSLTELGAEAKACKACDLWKNATQTVFGEGTESAEVVFIGEQPGDREDIEGRPFVGPAGKFTSRMRSSISSGLQPLAANDAFTRSLTNLRSQRVSLGSRRSSAL